MLGVTNVTAQQLTPCESDDSCAIMEERLCRRQKEIAPLVGAYFAWAKEQNLLQIGSKKLAMAWLTAWTKKNSFACSCVMERFLLTTLQVNVLSVLLPLGARIGWCSTHLGGTIQCNSIQHCRNSQGQSVKVVWVFPLFAWWNCNASLWPGAWSDWPHILKWSAAVVGQTVWHLQKENLKFAGASFGSSFIFTWRLWLSGY